MAKVPSKSATGDHREKIVEIDPRDEEETKEMEKVMGMYLFNN